MTNPRGGTPTPGLPQGLGTVTPPRPADTFEGRAGGGNLGMGNHGPAVTGAGPRPDAIGANPSFGLQQGTSVGGSGQPHHSQKPLGTDHDFAFILIAVAIYVLSVQLFNFSSKIQGWVLIEDKGAPPRDSGWVACVMSTGANHHVVPHTSNARGPRGDEFPGCIRKCSSRFCHWPSGCFVSAVGYCGQQAYRCLCIAPSNEDGGP